MLPDRIGNHRGLTLVEVLCATLIGASVVVLGSAVTAHIYSTNRTIQEELVQRWEEARLLDQFRCDVRSARFDFAFSADFSSGDRSESALLEFDGLVTTPTTRSPITVRWPSRIRYTVEPSPRTARAYRLVREQRIAVLGEVEDNSTQVMADELREIQLMQFIDSKWEPMKSPVLTKKDKPKALRLLLKWISRDRPVTECSVPLAMYSVLHGGAK